MKLLLDENVDYDFKYLLPQHDARHVADMGWKGLANGKLLDAAETESFEVVITADRNFRHQQNMAVRKLSLVVIEAHPNTLASLAACVP